MAEGKRVVVLGTGPAGAAAAWALHRAGVAVTVLDAGARGSDRGLTVRGLGLTLFRTRRDLPALPAGAGGKAAPVWYSELSAGGLSNHWTCAVPRFAPGDFDDGARLGEQHRWPVSYAELTRHYADMERLLRISGSAVGGPTQPAGEVADRVELSRDWQALAPLASALGSTILALPLSCSGGSEVVASGTVFNSYSRMIAPLGESDRFRVRFGARALRLEWSGGERRVTRVIYRDAATGKEEAIEATAVVVAAGALHSTRLLLESTSSGFPSGLGNSQGVLGRWLHDHPLGKVEFQLQRGLSVHPPVLLTRTPYADAAPLRASQSVLWGGTKVRAQTWTGLTPDRSRRIGFSIFGTVPPEERYAMKLCPGKLDAEGGTAFELSLDFDPATIQTLESARDGLQNLLDAAGYQPAVTSWKVEPVGTSVHYGGTVRMHASPKYGMLDGWNRLHAVPNVLVVDSSAFTTGPEKNPTLTAMALAARACERLAEDLRR